MIWVLVLKLFVKPRETHSDLTTEDIVFEPFSGEGNFVRAFPDIFQMNLITTEIQDGTDYKSADLSAVLHV